MAEQILPGHLRTVVGTALGAPRRGFQLALTCLLLPGATAYSAPREAVFVWYPDQAERPTSGECRNLLERTKPSRAKAEAWLWGRAPENTELEFYLVISEGRMDTTFAAEGDYDTGEVVWEATAGNVASFSLSPDDHPDMSITGTLDYSDLPVVTVTLTGIPATNGVSDRTTHYCRVGDEMET